MCLLRSVATKGMILSKERERRSGEVACCAFRSSGRESGGRFELIRDLGWS